MESLSIQISSSLSSLSSSSTSTDPETAIEHVEKISPNLGWSYRRDKISGKFEKIDDKTARLSAELRRYGEEVIPSMPTTPSMSTYRYPTTPLRRIFAPDGDVNRIFEQFPSVDESYIKQLMKMYNNRENLVISALLSEGYSRPNFIIDESLFYKMKATFPNVENEIIRKVLIKNENKEHAAISSLLSLYGLFNTVRYKYSRDSLKARYVKLKYLARKYPDIDEKVLLDLLFKNEHNAQRVIDYLKKLGCEQSELKMKISKISEVSLVKIAYEKLNTARPKELSYIQREHANFEEQEAIKRQLGEQFADIDPRLITIACESADFEIDLAVCFIETMTLPDDPDYITDSVHQTFFTKPATHKTRFVQTSLEHQDLFGLPEIIEKNADAELGKTMVDQATWTKEDEELTRRPPELVARPRCQAVGSSIPKEERPIREGPLKERTKALGSQCKANGSSIPAEERVIKLTPMVGRCRAQSSMGRQVVRIKEQVVYNTEDDIITVDNYIF